jgi:c-di-GMP-binding flagellar brake protein YcgR
MIERLINHYRAFNGNKRAEAVDPTLNRVYLELHQLQRNRSFIEIVVEGDEAKYQSIILSIDPEERTLLVDELFPSGFIGLSGQQVHVSIRQKAGRKIQFPTVILERHSQDGSPLYVLRMPEMLDLDQRRGAYRLPLNAKLAVESSFTAPDYQAYQGTLLNVSSSGICMEVESEQEEPLRYDDHLTHVAFDFAGQNIDCELAVRCVATVGDDGPVGGRYRWLVGAEFVDLPPLEQKVLAKSIMRIQRDRIKYSGEQRLQQTIY